MTLDDSKTQELVHTILDLSYCISMFSPAMKPFVRFSKDEKGELYPQLYWDFDDLVQKKLLGFVNEIASPKVISRSCIERWKRNLGAYERSQRWSLELVKRGDAEYTERSSSRFDFIVERVKPGGRFLYIGCGAGKECFSLAKRGLDVVGIDTMAPLLDISREWAMYLGRIVGFVRMDAFDLAFKPASFDGFLFEFYGSLPSSAQTLALQRELAFILNPGGRGFIVAARKKYSSYWMLMGSPYSSVMTDWLKPHAALDFFFSEPDACEERLQYGLYNRSHTLRSLSSDLSATFKVEECVYEQDPRYVIAVVSHKDEVELGETNSEVQAGARESERRISPSRSLEIENALEKIDRLCEHLRVHTEMMSAYFVDVDRGKVADVNPLKAISLNMSGFVNLLQDVLGSTPGV